MAHFQLHVDTDNAAFGETLSDVAAELARILRRLASEIDADGLPGTDDVERIRDRNGNTVGHYQHFEA